MLKNKYAKAAIMMIGTTAAVVGIIFVVKIIIKMVE